MRQISIIAARKFLNKELYEHGLSEVTKDAILFKGEPVVWREKNKDGSESICAHWGTPVSETKLDRVVAVGNLLIPPIHIYGFERWHQRRVRVEGRTVRLEREDKVILRTLKAPELMD